MRVLQLCHRVPFPANDGGNIAMLNFSNSLLSQGVNIKMLTLNTKKHNVNMASVPTALIHKYKMETIKVDTSVKPFDAFLNLFASSSYNIIRFFSEAFNQKLRQVLNENQYEIVLMESLFMAPYINTIRENSKAKIVLRSHNVEYMIWERLADNETNILRKKYLQMLSKRLKKYELETINKVDAILPITPDDETLLRKSGTKTPMHTVPVGVDINEYPGQLNESLELNLFHLGAMDWMPNLEGIEWFLKNTWPLVHNRFPSLKLFLAGRGFPTSLKDNAIEKVICEGEITDAKKYMSDKQIMIVPLRSGGGMRVKIVQGMALAKTIISTSIGAEGIKYTDGKNILIANTPHEFLSQIEKCLNDKNLCFNIGRNARNLVAENYSNAAIGKKVKKFFEEIVEV